MVYEEHSPIQPSIKWVMIMSMVLIAFVLWLVPPNNKGAQWFVFGVILLVYWGYRSMVGMKVVLESDRLVAYMQPFRHTVRYNDIASVERIERVPWYVGWGVRIWGRRLAFVNNHGPSVVIHKKSGFFDRIVLSAKDASALEQQIKQRVRK